MVRTVGRTVGRTMGRTVGREDTAENNMFFDKPWSEVTEQDIKDLSIKLQEYHDLDCQFIMGCFRQFGYSIRTLLHIHTTIFVIHTSNDCDCSYK